MQLIHRLQASQHFDCFGINWKWIFTLCCSFNDGSQSKGLQPAEERLLLSQGKEDVADIDDISRRDLAASLSGEARNILQEEGKLNRGLTVEEVTPAGPREIFEIDSPSEVKRDAMEVFNREEVENTSENLDEGLTNIGTAVTAFNFDVTKTVLIIDVIDVECPPKKNLDAPGRYQLNIKVFHLSGSTIKKWTSPLFEASEFPGPVNIECSDLTPKNILSTAIRIQLYGCEQMCGTWILSESTTAFASVNLLDHDPCRINLRRIADIKRPSINDVEVGLSRGVERKLKVIKGAHLGPLLQGANETTLFPTSISLPSQFLGPSPSPMKLNLGTKTREDGYTKQETSSKAVSNVKEYFGSQAELLMGLAYSPVSGRMTVEIVKGNCFKNPHTKGEEKMPNTFVKIVLLAGGRHEISKSKTVVQQSQSNPLFKEKFMFQISESQLSDVSLAIEVYHRRSINRKEIIGTFTLGPHSTRGETENHWNNMKESRGEMSFQWHTLRLDKKSRLGELASH